MSELKESNTVTTSNNQAGVKALMIGVPALIVLAGLGIVGGSYFTGTYLENNHQKFVSNINEYLAEQELLNEAGIVTEVKVIEFKRGLFSSDVNFRVRLNDEISVDGSSKVFHGPLPTNNFSSALASIETQLDMPVKLKEFFTDKILAKGTTNVSFSKEVSGDLALSGVDIKNDSDVIKLSPIKWTYRYSQDFKNSVNKIDIADLTVRSLIGQLALEQFSLNLNLTPSNSYQYIYPGSSNISVKNIELRAGTKKSDIADIKLSDIKLDGTTSLAGSRQKTESQFSIANTAINGLNFGKFDFATAVDTDAEIYDRLVAEATDGKGVNNKLVEELLLKKPVLQIKKLALENKNSNAQLDMNVNLGIDNIPRKALSEEEILKALSGSHINVAFDRDYLVEAMKLASMLKGNDASKASTKATQAVRLLFAGAESAEKFFKVKDNRLSFNLALTERDIIVNGVKLSEKDRLVSQQFLASPERLFNEFDSQNWAESLKFDTNALENELGKMAETSAVTAPTQAKEEPKVTEPEAVAEVAKAPEMPAMVSSNLDAACQLQTGVDDMAFLQACLKTSPSEEQIQEIIAQAKNLGACSVAQRLYANKGQSNPRIALAYAKEYDPQFAGSNICFNANKNTAVYWYETVMEMEPGNSEARIRLMELKK